MRRAPLRSLLSLLCALVFALGVTARRADAEPAPPFVVIVNESNPYLVLERSFVADAFLKKTTRWPNGNVIKAVDLVPDSPVREQFSNDVLKRTVAAVKSYWQQSIFAGRDVPPPELSNDDDVVKYVTAHPYAIGYVSGTAHLGDAKVATIR